MKRLQARFLRCLAYTLWTTFAVHTILVMIGFIQSFSWWICIMPGMLLYLGVLCIGHANDIENKYKSDLTYAGAHQTKPS